MNSQLIGAAAVALGLSAFGVGCDDEREDLQQERAEEAYGEEAIVAEGPVADEEMSGDGVASAETEPGSGTEMPPAQEQGGQGLATAGGTGAAMGDEEMESEPERIGMPSPGQLRGAVGAATSIPADGSLAEVVERVTRTLEENDLEVVHSQPLRARAPGGEGAAKPGEAPTTRGELILFTQTSALEEALAVNPARALDIASQLLVYESGDQVYLAFRTPEPGTQRYQPGYHGMHDSKPGEQPTATTPHAIDVEALAESAARSESAVRSERGEQERPADRGTQRTAGQQQPARQQTGNSTMDQLPAPTEAELDEMENEPAEGEENPFRQDIERDPEQGLR